MESLTPTEREVLEVYRQFPTYSLKQVANHLNKKSSNSIWKTLVRLKDKKYVELKQVRQFVHIL